MRDGSRRRGGKNPRAEELQDYVEGRLNSEQHVRIERYLRANPDQAARIAALKRHAVIVHSIGRDIAREPVPARLRRFLSALFRPH